MCLTAGRRGASKKLQPPVKASTWWDRHTCMEAGPVGDLSRGVENVNAEDPDAWDWIYDCSEGESLGHSSTAPEPEHTPAWKMAGLLPGRQRLRSPWSCRLWRRSFLPGRQVNGVQARREMPPRPRRARAGLPCGV